MNFDFASFLRGGARAATSPTSPTGASADGTPSRTSSGHQQVDAAVLLPPQSLAADALAAAVAAGDEGVAKTTVAKGRALRPGQDIYNIDLRQPGEEQPQLKVAPITMLKTDFRLEMLRQIAVNSTYICYGLKAGHIRVLNKLTAQRALLKGHTGLITDMQFFSPSSNLLASCSKRGDIVVREIVQSKVDIDEHVLLRFAGAAPIGFNTKLAWHPSDSNSLAYIAGGRLCFLHVPDPTSVTEAAELTDPALQLYHCQDEDFTYVAFSPSGECIAVSSQQGSCYAWWLLRPPCTVGEPNVAFKPHGGNPVSTVEFLSTTPTSARVLTGNATNSELKLWELVVPGQAQCLYCLNLEAAAPQSIYNHLVLQRVFHLMILANAQQTQVFAVHYTDQTDTLRFDYISEFSHMHRILSLMTEVDPSLEAFHLYCVQTEAIQQYTLDKASCAPAAEELAAQVELLATRKSLSELDAPSSSSRGDAAQDVAGPSTGATASTINPTFVTRATELTIAGGVLGPIAGEESRVSPPEPATSPLSSSGATLGSSVPAISTISSTLSETALSNAPALLGPVDTVTAAPPIIPSGSQTAYPPLPSFAPSMSSSSSLNSLPNNAASVTASMTLGSQGSLQPNAPQSIPNSPREAAAGATPVAVPPLAAMQPSPLPSSTPFSDMLQPSPVGHSPPAPPMQLLSPGASSLTSPARSMEAHAPTSFPTSFPTGSDVPTPMRLITPETFKTMPSITPDISAPACAAITTTASIPSLDTPGGALLHALLQRDLAAIGGAAAAAAAPPLPLGASPPLSLPPAGILPVIPLNPMVHSSESLQEVVTSAPVAASRPMSIPHLVGPLELMQELASDGSEEVTTAVAAAASAVAAEPAEPASAAMAAAAAAPAGGIPAAPDASTPHASALLPSGSLVVDEGALQRLQSTLLETLCSQHKEVLRGLSRLSGFGEVQKQLSKLETNVNKTLEQQLTKLSQRKTDEERRRNVALDASLEKMVTNLAAQISQNTASAFREATAQQAAALLAGLGPVLEKAIGSAVQGSLGAELAGPAMQGALQSAIGAQLKLSLFETLRRNFEVQVIPAFEKATQAMFGQIEAHLKWGLSEYLKQAVSTSTEMSSALRESTSQVQALTVQLASVKQELGELQGQLAQQVAAATQAAARAAATATAAAGPALPNQPMTLSQIEEQHDPRIYITNLLKADKFEDAFSQALSLSNLETLMWLVRQLSVKMLGDDPCPLSQPVLLSLVQQLAFDLQDETECKLEWILEAAHNLQAAEKYRGYMQQVLTNLNGLLATAPLGDVARKTKLCILLLKNLLA